MRILRKWCIRPARVISRRFLADDERRLIEPSYTLDELLAGITRANLHEEIDWGPAVGKEVW